VRNWDETIRRLARLSEIGFAGEPPAQSVQILVRGSVAALPLAGIIDFQAEKTRLTKEIGKLTGEVTKLETKLANADFVAKAPEEVIEENQDRLAESKERIGKLEAAFARLG
jgi:valyl-tRNA synthetase